MIIYEPVFPADILSFDLANLDSKSENFTFDYYLDYFLKNQSHFFAAKLFGGQPHSPSHMIYTNPVVGYIFGKKELKEKLCLHLSALSVAPSYRKLKIGSKLMRLFEENGDSVNAWFSDLFVRESNAAAILFYKKLGYELYRKIFSYYSYPAEDAFEMRKSLQKDVEKTCQIRVKDVDTKEM